MQTRARVCVQTHSCLQTPPHARVHTDGHTPPCPQTCAPHTRMPARTCVRARGESEERRGLRGPWLLGAGLGGLRPEQDSPPHPAAKSSRLGGTRRKWGAWHQHRRGVRRRPTEVCWEQLRRRTPSGPDAGGPAPRSPLPAAPGSRLLQAPRSPLPAPRPPAPVSATFLWSGPVGTRNLARREHCDQGQEQPPRSRRRPEEDCRGSPWSTTPPSEGTETPGPASTPRMPRPPHRAPMGLACSEREARLEGQQSGTRGGQGPGTLTGRPPGTPRPPSGGRGHR